VGGNQVRRHWPGFIAFYDGGSSESGLNIKKGGLKKISQWDISVLRDISVLKEGFYYSAHNSSHPLVFMNVQI
jgi:hypothetical protein